MMRTLMIVAISILLGNASAFSIRNNQGWAKHVQPVSIKNKAHQNIETKAPEANENTSAKQDHTHILICPGFSTSTKDYTKEGSLAPNLIGRGGWKAEQIHVLPMKRTDWAKVVMRGCQDSDFRAALAGIPGRGAPADRSSYRWYLKRIAKSIRNIDESVKAKHGEDATAKIILIGHSSGGWLARAAVGYGSEHKAKSTELEPELGIDIDNVLGIVTLGTPNLPSPEGRPDVTGGALRITNKRFPGAYFEDKLFYVTAAGSGILGRKNVSPLPSFSHDNIAYQSYESLLGHGETDGDGIVPVQSAHLEGANQINIDNICHAAQLATASVRDQWYGSNAVIDKWFSKVLDQLNPVPEKAIASTLFNRAGVLRRSRRHVDMNKVANLEASTVDHGRGTKTHINNIFVSLAVPWYFMTRQASAMMTLLWAAYA